MKKSLFALLLALLIVVFSLPVFAEDSAEMPDETETAEATEDLFYDPELPVELTVYVYDLCGGCGGGIMPGCGECDTTIKYHGVLTRELGDRLYDGSITYRIPNARMSDKLLQYEDLTVEMGFAEEHLNQFPTVLITQNGEGFYMVGEDAIYDIVEFLDAYMSGTSVAELQAEADKRYAERTAGETAEVVESESEETAEDSSAD